VGTPRVGVAFGVLEVPAPGDELVGSIPDLLVEVDESLVGVVDRAVVGGHLEEDGAAAEEWFVVTVVALGEARAQLIEQLTLASRPLQNRLHHWFSTLVPVC